MTLIEVIVVMILIGLISSVVMYNVKGSLDKGKALASEQKAEQIRNALMLYAVENAESYKDVVEHWKECLQKSLFIDPSKKNVAHLDAWGNEFKVEYIKTRNDIVVRSKKV